MHLVTWVVIWDCCVPICTGNPSLYQTATAHHKTATHATDLRQQPRELVYPIALVTAASLYLAYGGSPSTESAADMGAPAEARRGLLGCRNVVVGSLLMTKVCAQGTTKPVTRVEHSSSTTNDSDKARNAGSMWLKDVELSIGERSARFCIRVWFLDRMFSFGK